MREPLAKKFVAFTAAVAKMETASAKLADLLKAAEKELYTQKEISKALETAGADAEYSMVVEENVQKYSDLVAENQRYIQELAGPLAAAAASATVADKFMKDLDAKIKSVQSRLTIGSAPASASAASAASASASAASLAQALVASQAKTYDQLLTIVIRELTTIFNTDQIFSPGRKKIFTEKMGVFFKHLFGTKLWKNDYDKFYKVDPPAAAPPFDEYLKWGKRVSKKEFVDFKKKYITSGKISTSPLNEIIKDILLLKYDKEFTEDSLLSVLEDFLKGEGDEYNFMTIHDSLVAEFYRSGGGSRQTRRNRDEKSKRVTRHLV